MNKLSPEEIDNIANLSRLDLSEKEKKMYAEQLSVVFDYIKMLEKVNTEDVAETCQVTGLEDIVRKDEVKECDEEARQKLIEQFPEKIGDLLKVKKVFE